MNAASATVFAAVLALAAFAIWRTLKKGAPCECGCSRKTCPGKCPSCTGCNGR